MLRNILITLLISICVVCLVSGSSLIENRGENQEVNPIQQLRVVNSGTVDIHRLYVLFPGPTAESEATRIGFGNIRAGETTNYQQVPSGVYRYAAYQYTLNSQTISQPVVDWVGENPLAGVDFTYRIILDTTRVPGAQMQLSEVLIDRP